MDFENVLSILVLPLISNEILNIINNDLDKKENKEIMNQLFEKIDFSIMITDNNNKINYVNKKFEEETGYIENEVLNEDPNFLRSNYHNYLFYDNLKAKIENNQVWKGKIKSLKKNNNTFWEYANIFPIVINNTNKYYMKISKNIGRLQKLEKDLQNGIIINKLFQSTFSFNNIENDKIKFNAFNQKYKNINGDFYIWKEINPNKYICIAFDLVNNSLITSLLGIWTLNLIYKIIDKTSNIKSIVNELNDFYIRLNKSIDSDLNYYASMFAFSIDLRKEKFNVINCGYPIFYMIKNKEIIDLTEIDYPIGIYKKRNFEILEYKYKEPFELIILTDGILRTSDYLYDGQMILKEFLDSYVNSDKNLIDDFKEQIIYNYEDVFKDDVTCLTIDVKNGDNYE
ncbi:MAG: SpoIIE family protein phosphatase [Bacillota bacterium]